MNVHVHPDDAIIFDRGLEVDLLVGPKLPWWKRHWPFRAHQVVTDIDHERGILTLSYVPSTWERVRNFLTSCRSPHPRDAQSGLARWLRCAYLRRT